LLVTAVLVPPDAAAACLVASALSVAAVTDTETSLMPRQPAEPGRGVLHRFAARKAERDRDADAAGLSASADALAASRASAIRARLVWWRGVGGLDISCWHSFGLSKRAPEQPPWRTDELPKDRCRVADHEGGPSMAKE